MKLFAVIFSLWTIILISGKSDAIPPEPPASTSLPITTTVAPTTSPSPGPITTSTSKPTPAPTTTPTTTPAPATTPEPTSTTTPAPAPAPVVKPGKWVVNGTNKTCIIVTMAAKFNLVYITTNKTMSKAEIILPSDNKTAISSGDCQSIEQAMNITWPSKSNVTKNLLTLHFVKNGTDAYSLHHIELYLAVEELPMINYTSPVVMFIHNSSEFRTSLTNSYRCAKLQTLPLTSNVNKTSGEFRFSDLQFQAFREDAKSVFGYAEDCAYETQDVVPIAVGCALIVLIVIVLVAYLVGRRRSQARGYLSM